MIAIYDYDSGYKLGYASQELQSEWNRAVASGQKFILDPNCGYTRKLRLSEPSDDFKDFPERCSER